MSTDSYLLLGAYAVDAVDDAERADVEAYLADYPDHDVEMLSLREAAHSLSVLTTAAPPARLRTAVLDQVRQTRPLPPQLPEQQRSSAPEPATEHVVEPTPKPADELAARRKRRAPWLLGAAAAAVVAVGGVGVWSPWDTGETPTQIAISQVTDAPDSRQYSLPMGQNRVTITRSASTKRAVLTSVSMPDAPAGRTYQMWLQQPDGSMRSAGLVPQAHNGAVTMLLEGDAARAVGAGITVEPAGGSPQPTSNPLGVVEF